MRFDEFRAREAANEAIDQVTERIIGAAIEVHREMGPGLTEIMYEAALCREFDLRHIRYDRQVPVSVSYKGVVVGEARMDLLSQCITYLRATGHRVALVINFNVPVLRDGIKRVILSN